MWSRGNAPGRRVSQRGRRGSIDVKSGARSLTLDLFFFLSGLTLEVGFGPGARPGRWTRGSCVPAGSAVRRPGSAGPTDTPSFSSPRAHRFAWVQMLLLAPSWIFWSKKRTETIQLQKLGKVESSRFKKLHSIQHKHPTSVEDSSWADDQRSGGERKTCVSQVVLPRTSVGFARPTPSFVCCSSKGMIFCGNQLALSRLGWAQDPGVPGGSAPGRQGGEG